ncbi:hypothetical protein D9623_12505 [Azospirillum brasilense]|uniref:Uncharacterized protein n=1 Tax=Azospirillum brasilense TaxID=192 RepID=A0A0P0F2A5_AZOBR|nr:MULTISPECIES: hypothetical protein [Azospirillum]ALJ34609.1 hypothetical protein AMK58_03770 [Azospirillum brasilense]MDW7554027.1 hypothetical protein [Azospirillum brasilense]MDW7593006.1 hypothetical protein [Azospirillum brasilense]MDW7593714.1 hypothetical protein [Azospirillum brasilense]MDW7627043.1 hypothetical protein [Azospirillum brasilense]
MGFASDWKSAKTTFETATGKKKPSAKFMGVFHKSGLEDVTKALDTALGKSDAKALEKALLDYVKSATAYQTTLEKSAKAEGVATIATELKKLGQALDDIGRRAGVAVNERIAEMREDAEAEKAKEAEEQGKAARAIADKVAVQIDGLLKATNADIKLLDQAAANADLALRNVLEAQGAGNAKEAKAQAAAVQTAAKTVDAQAKKVAATAVQAAKLFSQAKAAVAKMKLDPKQYGGRDPAQGAFDRADAIVMKLDQLKDDTAEAAAEAAGIVKEAAQALKGALDLRATYLASCRKLAKRAQDADSFYDNIARDVGGQADRAQQEQMVAEEAEDDKRAASIKTATFYITQVRQQAAQAKKEILAAANEITGTRKSFPSMVSDKDPDFGPLLAGAKVSLDGLKESHAALTKAETKIDKVETALKKLG